jgi:hypothetical protein
MFGFQSTSACIELQLAESAARAFLAEAHVRIRPAGLHHAQLVTPAALVAGISRRLPLRLCRYQIIIGYNVWCLLIIWEA